MNQTDLQLTGGAGKTKRRELDFYPTPKNITHALMDFLYKECDSFFDEDIHVWEPACGNGQMVEVINSYGNRVYGTDINDYGFADPVYGNYPVDFLKQDLQGHYDAIITNPPFDLSEQFIRTAISRARIVCMLFKSQYWHAKSRYALFNEFKPRYVLPLTWRPDFYEHLRMPGDKTPAPTMEVAWTIWTKGNNQITQYIPLLKP